jgi:DNA-binding LytR/AlgR family response regulator
LGLEIAEDIRRGAFHCIPKDTPIVFLTARQNKEIIADIESNMQAVAYMDKPTFVQDIVEQVSKIVA